MVQISQSFLEYQTHERTHKAGECQQPPPCSAVPESCTCWVHTSQHIVFWFLSSLLTRIHFPTSSSPAASSTRHPTRHFSDRQSSSSQLKTASSLKKGNHWHLSPLRKAKPNGVRWEKQGHGWLSKFRENIFAWFPLGLHCVGSGFPDSATGVL